VKELSNQFLVIENDYVEDGEYVTKHVEFLRCRYGIALKK